MDGECVMYECRVVFCMMVCTREIMLSAVLAYVRTATTAQPPDNERLSVRIRLAANAPSLFRLNDV